MKRIIIAGALTLMCSAAFAQSTGAPAAAQSDMNKPGMMNNNSGMGSNMNSGTTGSGMKQGMSKEKMGKDEMKKDSMSKDGMKK